MIKDKLPDAVFGVICAEHGKQGLSEKDYHDQMMNPYSSWFCPICRGFAAWDDQRYEDYMNEPLELSDKMMEIPTGELPKVFSPSFTEKQLSLVGAATTFLKIILKQDPIQTKVAKTAVVMMAASRPGGTDATMEELKEINDQFHRLLGRTRCPDCGEYHE